jgi:hypothetical protein
VLKKAGVAVGITAAALLALSPLAFADDDGGHDDGHAAHVQFLPGVQDKVIQHPIKFCNGKYLEGKAHNSDSHHGDCDQDVSPHHPDDF